MPGGRGKRIPMEVKAATGTLKKDREQPKSHLPVVKVKEPAEPPLHFNDPIYAEALKLWHHYEPMAREIKVLATTDLAALARLCETEMRYRKLLDEQTKDYGGLATIIDGKTGKPVLNPIVKTLNELTVQLTRLYECFGFTPASRAKVAVVKQLQDEKENPVAKLVQMQQKALKAKK